MSRSNPPRRGNAGALVYKHKPAGRTPGVPISDAERRANLNRNAGGALTKADRGVAKRVLKFDVPEVVGAFHEALEEGNVAGINRLASRAMAETEVMRRGIADDVRRRGVVLEDSVVSPTTGDVVGSKVRIHPGFDAVLKANEQLDFTSEARRLDPRSRGEGARDQAVAAALRRDKFLRGYAGNSILPPPAEDEQPVDAELVAEP